MKKKIGILFIVCVLIFIIGCNTVADASSPYIPTEGLDILPFFEDNEEIEELQHRQDIAHQMAECARELGYTESHSII